MSIQSLTAIRPKSWWKLKDEYIGRKREAVIQIISVYKKKRSNNADDHAYRTLRPIRYWTALKDYKPVLCTRREHFDANRPPHYHVERSRRYPRNDWRLHEDEMSLRVFRKYYEPTRSPYI